MIQDNENINNVKIKDIGIKAILEYDLPNVIIKKEWFDED